MAVHGIAAPPTPWSKGHVEPKVDQTAYVHAFSNIIGDVRVGANVLVAPGTSIRADEGSPFHIGQGTNIQDGVVIHGLEQGQVLGDDQQRYSVWIGNNASITHMSLIHGPAYVGDDCFIGFRSTVFNARVGKGCIVMMHALIKDVELPPGKYVPSGSIITNQKQADRLPDVQAADIEFATHVVGINDALRSGYLCADDVACITSMRNQLTKTYSTSNGFGASGASSNLSSEVVEQVQQLLNQGYQVGTEHADKRRFRANAWASCPTIETSRASEALAELEACLAEHAGEYVRLIGIDPKAKRRVLETVIQRPEDPAVQRGQQTSSSYQAPPRPAERSTTSSSTSNRGSSSSNLSSEVVEQVQQLLNQGYQVGTEHADKRRFRANAWASCPTIETSRASEALAELEACLAEHAGEYVRLIGIDPKAKRRVLETVIQRPEDPAVQRGQQTSSSYQAPPRPAERSTTSSSTSNRGSSSSNLSSEVVEQVQQLLNQGYQVGTEHADKRRFRANAWASCPTIETSRASEALAELEACLAEHAGEYVRLIGIDPKAKRRVLETVIQRPGQ